MLADDFASCDVNKSHPCGEMWCYKEMLFHLRVCVSVYLCVYECALMCVWVCTNVCMSVYLCWRKWSLPRMFSYPFFEVIYFLNKFMLLLGGMSMIGIYLKYCGTCPAIFFYSQSHHWWFFFLMYFFLWKNLRKIKHTHTYTHPHAKTHTNTHTCTHTHTHIESHKDMHMY